MTGSGAGNRQDGSGVSGSGRDLYSFLVDSELEHYYTALTHSLKVTRVEQIKYVDDADLAGIGMTNPEMRRLRKQFRRECPQSAVGRLRKRLAQARGIQPRLRPASPTMSHLGFEIAARRGGQSNLIPTDQLQIGRLLGDGDFARVHQAVWRPTGDRGQRLQVAAKIIFKAQLAPATATSEGSNAVAEFLRETAQLNDIDHRSVTRLFGVSDLSEDCLALVTELAPLRSLLECVREPALRASFHPGVLCEAAQQVAEGMSYLENRRIVHRDLAARNLLVFSPCRVKIGDTGVSRALGLSQEYYQANLSASLKLPAAWCAPECVKHLAFTSASDVWSYGVVLWEAFTYGFQPWAGLTKQQILAAVDEPQLGRLCRPDACPAEHYALMLRCWSPDPKLRPTFAELAAHLPKIIPERMTALRDCAGDEEEDSASGGAGGDRFLHFSAGDSVLVLDKEAGDGFWRGVRLAGGGSGVFRPWLMKTQQLAQPAAMSSASSDSMQTGSRRHSRCTPISEPQSFKHLGHVGINGAVFGDVGFLAQVNEALTAAMVATTAAAKLEGGGPGDEKATADDDDYLKLDLGESLMDEVLKLWSTEGDQGCDSAVYVGGDRVEDEEDAFNNGVNDFREARRARVDSAVSSVVSSLTDEIPAAAASAGGDRRRCSSLLAIPSTTGRLHPPPQQQQQQQAPLQKQTSNGENRDAQQQQQQQQQTQPKQFIHSQPSTLRSLRPKEAFRAPLGALPPPKPVRPLEPDGSPWGSAFNVSRLGLDAAGTGAAGPNTGSAQSGPNDDASCARKLDWSDYDGGEYDEIVNL